ncbi:MAG: HD domain-containing protein [Pedobacter sp.]|uniref:HD domain-containing protein n=1 Tax=Pedobacter sp. TaxID=1411316 RepID=UPI0028084809|nr:HD domain-containing protein [Pedobacter sp.]MDQ8004940.1 HD domain-containing protein [Pedobacter sp.]
MPQTEEILMKVAAFATNAHAGQQRKYVNEPYIEHPVRVMYMCMAQQQSLHVLCAALLHDVLEDTSIHEDELLAFLGELFLPQEAKDILSTVVELTDVYIKKAYPHWNRKIRKEAELERLKRISSGAQTIKYADILDNSEAIATQDPGFAAVLLKEYQHQVKVLNGGDSTLRQMATEKLEAALKTMSNKAN